MHSHFLRFPLVIPSQTQCFSPAFSFGDNNILCLPQVCPVVIARDNIDPVVHGAQHGYGHTGIVVYPGVGYTSLSEKKRGIPVRGYTSSKIAVYNHGAQ